MEIIGLKALVVNSCKNCECLLNTETEKCISKLKSRFHEFCHRRICYFVYNGFELIQLYSLYNTDSTIFELLYNVVQGNNSGAYRELVTCLRVLQCPLPVTRLEVCSALFWQMLRQFLHRLYIGRWLSSYSGGLFATPYVSLSKLKILL